ncbi:MAG: response regulator [Clostridiaceae bacterium]
MYKLLVADDEKIVVDSVGYIIKKNFDNIQVEFARSGREAIEKSDIFRPDFILMDIKMPGINGIDAIKEIKERYPSTYFIVISAYEQFDFAKEAVKLGVSEYILKPFNKDILISSIKKLILTIEKDRNKKNKELENIERYEKAIPFLEHGFIYSILLGEDYNTKMIKYRDILNLRAEGGYILIVEFKGKDEENYLSVLDKDFYIKFREQLKFSKKCLVGPLMLNRVVVFIPSEIKDEYTNRIESLRFCEHIINKYSKLYPDLLLKIGIGSYKSLNNVSISYSEALNALHDVKNKKIFHIKDLLINEKNYDKYPQFEESEMIEKCLNGESEESIYYFKKVYDYILKKYYDNFQEGKGKFLEVSFLLHSRAFEKGLDESYYGNYLLDIIKTKDYIEIKHYYLERIMSITKALKHVEQEQINDLIKMAKVYIDKKYKEEISLEDVAKDVSLSPHYFSRLFKDETGENFIDYITRTRIDKAKKLMKLDKMTIKEICFEVGYQDPNYFSRLFKKSENITPTEYIKNIFNKR